MQINTDLSVKKLWVCTSNQIAQKKKFDDVPLAFLDGPGAEEALSLTLVDAIGSQSEEEAHYEAEPEAVSLIWV